MTLNSISRTWDSSGATVNQGGFKLTVVPFGGITELKKVSDLFPTFVKLLCTVSDLTSDDTVTEGRFKLAGWLSDWLHHAPVTALIVDRSMSGKEHKKLM